MFEIRLTQYVFLEDPEKLIEEKSVICILTSYKHNQDVLELKEEELLPVHNKIHQTNDVLTHSLTAFLLMNMRLCDIHQGDETGVLLRLDDYLHMNGEVKLMKITEDEKLKYVGNFGEH